MSTTITYKGWISVGPPRRGRQNTVILSPSRFFYRPKNHVLSEKISQDIVRYGPYVNIRMWAYHAKIKPSRVYLANSLMGYLSAEYSEISNSNNYYRTIDFITMGSFNLLEELVLFYHHYCILEITYSQSEFDMISHEMELILLLSQDF